MHVATKSDNYMHELALSSTHSPSRSHKSYVIVVSLSNIRQARVLLLPLQAEQQQDQRRGQQQRQARPESRKDQ